MKWEGYCICSGHAQKLCRVWSADDVEPPSKDAVPEWNTISFSFVQNVKFLANSLFVYGYEFVTEFTTFVRTVITIPNSIIYTGIKSIYVEFLGK